MLTVCQLQTSHRASSYILPQPSSPRADPLTTK